MLLPEARSPAWTSATRSANAPSTDESESASEETLISPVVMFCDARLCCRAISRRPPSEGLGFRVEG